MGRNGKYDATLNCRVNMFGFAKRPNFLLNSAHWTSKAAPWMPVSINVSGHLQWQTLPENIGLE